ncbi:MAG: 4-hydroxy-tetrahydrodipicolinate synthase [Acidobacteria bacterium]|nr:MAG: 4-hydroxy-tetrahydrodipicolinate synthase [Acidobacteriota bacterium]REK04178.1 MAG: 4-hydroxy-tetrahydrodipicolinate synthase [Acidobacteriota bacterium]REK15340.1 MAG: 4-hydroxy-tetrahydrodipicolinate synthase [Acidobacteriota bacterium]REK46430.1 MAG: 4-hydroxy-tetrahydrodipicolinate synthase [Acidobacteriota bacterium]
MNLTWLKGCATALVTPFRKDGSIDEECFKSLAERQIANGVNILVPCGTTGESVTMSEDERLRVIRLTIEVAKAKKAKVIAGTGSNNTAATIDFTRKVRQLGADMALVVAPYYNKPTQDGMFAHFSEIANSVKDLPIMLYNVPGRTSSNISAETTFRLAEACPNIVATKEASGDFSQIMEIIRTRPKNFKLFSGDDMTTLSMIAAGADGLVSVCANEIPKETSQMVNAALDGGFSKARRIHYKILELMEANFIEASPAPCKFVMKEMGLLEENLRLPLVPVKAKTRKTLRRILSALQSQ